MRSQVVDPSQNPHISKIMEPPNVLTLVDVICHEKGRTSLALEPEETWLKSWVDVWGKKLLGFATLYTRDYALSQDLVQETFFKLYRWHQRHPNDVIHPGWLYRVLSREIVTTRRRHPMTTQPIDDASTLPTHESTDLRIEVQDTLLRLPLPDQECLWLFYYLDWPVSKIASALHVTPETVRGRLFRARQRFRDIWEGAPR